MTHALTPTSEDLVCAQVAASKGHIVELASKRMGVDPASGYALEWALLPRKTADLRQVEEVASGAKAIILATDPDREGEGISWHLLNHLQVGAVRPIGTRLMHGGLLLPPLRPQHLIA